MARFGPFNIFSLYDVNRAFKSLTAGLYKLNAENFQDGSVSNVKAGFELEDFELTVTGTGAMTIAAVVVTRARYTLLGDLLFVSFRVSFTTGGVAAKAVMITLPGGFEKIPRNERDVANMALFDGTWDDCFGLFFAPNQMVVYKPGLVNYGLGAGREIRANFWIEMKRSVTLL